ncbi:MAG: hypothetical protein C0412_10450 [Flavobacterium sp.]|nr:hypothetical protein [Flavobacterium sp.]
MKLKLINGFDVGLEPSHNSNGLSRTVLCFLAFLLTVFVCQCLESEFLKVSVQAFFVIIILISSCIEKGLKKQFFAFFIFLEVAKVGLGIWLFANDYIFSDSLEYLAKVKLFQTDVTFDFKGLISSVGSLHFFYELVNYWVFELFGNTFYSLVLLNICLSGLGTLNFYDVIRKDFGTKAASVFLIFSLLSMNITIFSGWIFKEALVLYLSSLITLIWQRFTKFEQFGDLLLYFVLIVPLAATRIYAGIACFAYFILYLLNNLSNRPSVGRCLKVFALCVVFFLLLPTLYLDLIYGQFYRLSLGSLFVNGIKQLLQIAYSPLLINLMSLFPYYQILVLDSVIISCFSLFLARFFYLVLACQEIRRKAYLFLLPILIYSLALASNYSDAGLRQKMAIMPLVYGIIAIGVCFKRNKLREC